MGCGGCEVSILKIGELFKTRETTIRFLMDHGAIASTLNCVKCGQQCNLDPELKTWRCQRTVTERRGKKVIKKRCYFKKSIWTNSALENIHMPIEKACKIIALSLIVKPAHRILGDEFQLTSSTICSWRLFVRDILKCWAKWQSKQIGGKGKIVEIDEAKFGKRKHNCGRKSGGFWVLGGIERGSKNLFLEVVRDRSTDTLLEIIQRKVKPGTTIVTDSWKAYSCLRTFGYQHYCVNHKTNFVHPQSGAHIQCIERTWRDIRSNMTTYGRKKDRTDAYLAESLFWRIYQNHLDRVHAFFKVVGVIHQKKSKKQSSCDIKTDTKNPENNIEDFIRVKKPIYLPFRNIDALEKMSAVSEKDFEKLIHYFKYLGGNTTSLQIEYILSRSITLEVAATIRKSKVMKGKFYNSRLINALQDVVMSKAMDKQVMGSALRSKIDRCLSYMGAKHKYKKESTAKKQKQNAASKRKKL